MTETDLTAVLKTPDALEIRARKGYWATKTGRFRLYEDGAEVAKLKPIADSEAAGWLVFDVPVSWHFVPGREYEIADAKNEFVPLDLTVLATTPEFDRAYRYDGPLGASYAPDQTVFRLFSPLAAEFCVRLRKPGAKDFAVYPMNRLDCGVFEAAPAGDWERAAYYYEGRINGQTVRAVDPYALAANANSRYGYVIDPRKAVAESLNRERLPTFTSPSQAMIYELDVRDLTSRLDLPDKGTFNALARPGLTYGPDGFPAGLDYVKGLGFTHVQLLPVLDFQTVDDNDPAGSYNWGYDPLLYFVPEGSYSSAPDDPYARILELRHLVSVFHQNGIRVNFDVVYNHVFDRATNPLEILCPGYYFRLNADGSYSNGSFCGNDLESRHYMCGRLIRDSLAHVVAFFGADGFRFDLMAIIDKDTLLKAQAELTGKVKGLMFYGEGWDMPTALPPADKSALANAFSLPAVGFFADRFRDSAKGGTSAERLAERGYVTGAADKIEDFKFAYAACCLRIGHNPVFANPMQAIDYVEVHDNNTLFDKLTASLPQAPEDEKLAYLKMLNAVTLLAAGIPLIHAGQEIGATKGMDENSFDAGDAVNGLDYGLAASRRGLYDFMKALTAFRRDHPEFCFKTKEQLRDGLSFRNLDKGALLIRYSVPGDGFFYVFVNPNRESISYNFKNYVKVVFRETGAMPADYDFYSQLVLLNGLSVTVCYSRDEVTA